ncbi:MAG: thioredoxin family protein [Phycisphaeraceae bacterium]|nr:thioredoxin family protein [Phycisphaeraceae bacterium]
MKRGITGLVCAICLWMSSSAGAQLPVPEDYTELARSNAEFSAAKLVAARYNGQDGVGVLFEGSEDLHYYANPKSAPVEGMELTVVAQAEGLVFGTPILPPSSLFVDPALGETIDVFVGQFHLFIPLVTVPDPTTAYSMTVTIDALTCTSTECLPPFTRALTLDLTPDKADWIILAASTSEAPHSPEDTAPAPPIIWGQVLRYLFLALLAGVLINAMPCVLPVIPIIIMRLVEQSKQSRSQRLLAGASFCFGIILFFAGFAAIAAIINLTTGAVINLNSLFRDPNLAIGLFLIIILFALIMVDFLPMLLPSSVAGHQTKGSGAGAALGTGFFAAILSIPCSGALLGSVLVWAQTQPIWVSSLCILFMGLGMALPYALIISNPALLSRLPKPGVWMEHFKKACGFLLLFIAVKLSLAALPKDRLINVLLYGIVFSFCVWVSGTWVNFSTPANKKRLVRLGMLVLAVGAGFWLLPSRVALVHWQSYDAAAIQEATDRDQPVLIKFTADWCSNCKVVDRKVYHAKDVVDLIEAKGILPIKADTTTKDLPATLDLNALYGEAGNVPVTILLLPGQDPVKIRGIFKKQALADILSDLPTS